MPSSPGRPRASGAQWPGLLCGTPATYDVLDALTRQLFAERARLRRWGLPAEAGEAALFLASEQHGFITGQTLDVDGGVVRW